MEEMKRREMELNHSKSVQKAYAICSSLGFEGGGMHGVDAAAVSHQIRLRVVREFGLPDSTVEILSRPYSHFSSGFASSSSPRSGKQDPNMATSCNFTPVRRSYCPQHSNCHLTSLMTSSNSNIRCPYASSSTSYFGAGHDGFFRGSSPAGILSSSCARRMEVS